MLKMDYKNILRRAKRAHNSIPDILRYCNRVMEGFGVEFIRSVDDTQYEFLGLEYVNMGDTYSETILYDHKRGQFRITTWGYIVEANNEYYI